MKKVLFLLLIILISGCWEKKKEEIIKSSGELICTYKENRINENTLYTSYYLYKYTEQGILESVINTEKIEYNNASQDIKEYYKKSLDKVLTEYEDIDGISVTKEENDKYLSFSITMDIYKMDDKRKEQYNVNKDRISSFKFFINKGYSCE